MLEFFKQTFMNRITKVSNWGISSNDNRSIIIWNLSFWFSINTNQVQILPNFLHQFIKVPFILSGNRNVMRTLVNDIELFNRDWIYFIQNINARNVNSISFNYVDQFIDCRVTSEVEVGIWETIFCANWPNCLITYICKL